MKTKYKIENKYKMPQDSRLKKLRGKAKAVDTTAQTREQYPLSRLEVGQSFTVQGKTAYELRGPRYYATQRYNRSFIARTLPNGAARVWRVA